MHTHEMISSHPQLRGGVSDILIRCIDACYDCAQTCTACADANLGEKSVSDLILCIRLNLDCADLCVATGAIASRRTGNNQAVLRHVIESCAEACRVCGEECARHAKMHEHCRISCRSMPALLPGLSRCCSVDRYGDSVNAPRLALENRLVDSRD